MLPVLATLLDAVGMRGGSLRARRLRMVRRGDLLPITPEEIAAVESVIAAKFPPTAMERYAEGCRQRTMREKPLHVSIAPAPPLPPTIRPTERLRAAVRGLSEFNPGGPATPQTPEATDLTGGYYAGRPRPYERR